VFVLYQLAEELPVGDVHSFFKDVGVFLAGLVLGMGMYWGIVTTTLSEFTDRMFGRHRQSCSMGFCKRALNGVHKNKGRA
jgi:hypothetical protein